MMIWWLRFESFNKLVTLTAFFARAETQTIIHHRCWYKAGRTFLEFVAHARIGTRNLSSVPVSFSIGWKVHVWLPRKREWWRHHSLEEMIEFRIAADTAGRSVPSTLFHPRTHDQIQPNREIDSNFLSILTSSSGNRLWGSVGSNWIRNGVLLKERARITLILALVLV